MLLISLNIELPLEVIDYLKPEIYRAARKALGFNPGMDSAAALAAIRELLGSRYTF